MMSQFHGQAGQDEFVLNVLKFKTNGFFVEIGSNDPVFINNTFLLETQYNWTGIMIEAQEKLSGGPNRGRDVLDLYKKERQHSHYIIDDARKVDYIKAFNEYNAPHNIDYLQLDLDVENYSTLDTLRKLDETVMDEYKFATVTFEHDLYRMTDHSINTKTLSRKIFEKRGYKKVFDNIIVDFGCHQTPTCSNCSARPFEDWYIHPDLVDIDYITKLQAINGNDLHWESIKYL